MLKHATVPLQMNNLTIIQFIISHHPQDKKSLSKIKRKLARNFGIKIVKNNWLLKIYRKALLQKQITQQVWLEELLVKRRIRTLSGVAPVTIATKPFPCPGRCIYCPTDAKMPKSYLPNQPAAARALHFKYNAFRQVQGRLQALYNNGHKPEKVDMRILGGTWSFYPKKYQIQFIKTMYHGLNTFNPNKNIASRNSSTLKKTQTLKSLQKTNEKAKYRCIGLSVETRPDHITFNEIKHLRNLGVTKVELGVQHLDQKILNLVKRDQTKNDVICATKLLKDAGFKICYHIMPNLPGSTPSKDLKMFKELFSNTALCPDQLKIYPCTVLKNAPLYKWYKQGKYKTYTDKILIALLAKMKTHVPPYIRIERIYRDVPSTEIINGCKHLNIRELVQKQMQKNNTFCKCIRCREVRDKPNNTKAKLFTKKYTASKGVEYFISFESSDRKILYAFARLRLPAKNSKNQLQSIKNTAIIRELHTYGKLAPLTTQHPLHNSNHSQHKGLGKKLLKKAEQIACTCAYHKIAVISGIGVREYYRKHNYTLEGKHGYMIKKLGA